MPWAWKKKRLHDLVPTPLHLHGEIDLALSAQKRNRSYLMQVLLNRAGSASAFVLGRLFFGCFPFRKELRAKIGLFLVKLIELAVLSLAGISHLRLVFKIQRHF